MHIQEGFPAPVSQTGRSGAVGGDGGVNGEAGYSTHVFISCHSDKAIFTPCGSPAEKERNHQSSFHIFNTRGH